MIDANESEAEVEPSVDVLLGWVDPQEGGGTALLLEHPVKLGTHTTTRLVFARMVAKHMRVMKDDSVDSLLLVAQEMTNESRRIIDNLAPTDTARVLEVVRRGFSSGPATGGAS